MTRRVLVEVPASCSNLGSGFDCVGIAVDRRLRLTAELAPGAGVVIERRGALRALDLEPARDRLWVAFAAACRAAGTALPPGLRLAAHSDIPVGRGLGSSAAAAVAGAAAANALLNLGLASTRLVSLGAELEGHADNVAAAVCGGVVLVVGGSAAPVVTPLAVAPALCLVFAVPDFAVETARARAALPSSVPHEVATAAAARSAALVAGLARGDATLLALALDDLLHVPYREALVPGFAAVTAAARAAGAIGATLSGSGSSIVAVADAAVAPAIGPAMVRAWTDRGVGAEWFVASSGCPGYREESRWSEAPARLPAATLH